MAFDLDAFQEKTYGFPDDVWTGARDWLMQKLRRVAGERSGKTVAYSVLCDEMRAKGIIDLDPHGIPLAGLLGQINVREYDAGNPLISAVVVNLETMEPGAGFWHIAEALDMKVGGSPDEREAFWVHSLEECYRRWQPTT